MAVITIKTSPAVGFERAKRLAERRLSSDMAHPMTLSWYDRCSGRGSIDHECAAEGEQSWETYGRTRGGTRVDVGRCYSFYVGDAAKEG